MLSGCRLEAFCHATEDEDKVLRAFRNALPEKLRDKKADTEVLRGLYGNKILKLSLKLARKRESRDFVEHLKNNLPEEDLKRLVSEASDRLDGSGFFFRLDKQEAYHGRLKLAGSGEDTIGVRLTIEVFVDTLGAKEKEIEKLFSDWVTIEGFDKPHSV